MKCYIQNENLAPQVYLALYPTNVECQFKVSNVDMSSYSEQIAVQRVPEHPLCRSLRAGGPSVAAHLWSQT